MKTVLPVFCTRIDIPLFNNNLHFTAMLQFSNTLSDHNVQNTYNTHYIYSLNLPILTSHLTKPPDGIITDRLIKYKIKFFYFTT